MSPNNSFKIVRLEDLPDPHEILSEKEFSKYNSFKVEKRKREWLGGRFAAKSAILDRRQKTEGRGQKLQDIEITCDKYGRPCWKDYLLSISHSGDYAIASANNGNRNFLGIDIEKIEQRHPLWAKDYFHNIEITENTPQFLTELWTRKEAILKALGLGLKADPFDIIIMKRINPVKLSPDEHRETPAKRDFTGVKFLNKALLRYKELGEPDFTIKTIKFKNYVVTTVTST